MAARRELHARIASAVAHSARRLWRRTDFTELELDEQDVLYHLTAALKALGALVRPPAGVPPDQGIASARPHVQQLSSLLCRLGQRQQGSAGSSAGLPGAVNGDDVLLLPAFGVLGPLRRLQRWWRRRRCERLPSPPPWPPYAVEVNEIDAVSILQRWWRAKRGSAVFCKAVISTVEVQVGCEVEAPICPAAAWQEAGTRGSLGGAGLAAVLRIQRVWRRLVEARGVRGLPPAGGGNKVQAVFVFDPCLRAWKDADWVTYSGGVAEKLWHASQFRCCTCSRPGRSRLVTRKVDFSCDHCGRDVPIRTKFLICKRCDVALCFQCLQGYCWGA